MTFGPDNNGSNPFDPLQLFISFLGQGAEGMKDVFSSPEAFATKVPGVINITDLLGDSSRIFGPNVAQRSSHGYLGSKNENDGSVSYYFNLAGFKKSEINVSLNESKSEVTVVASKKDIGEAKNPIFGLVSEVVKVEENATSKSLSPHYENGLLTINVKPSFFEDENSTVINID